MKKYLLPVLLLSAISATAQNKKSPAPADTLVSIELPPLKVVTNNTEPDPAEGPVFMFVEQMPEYPGGETALFNFVKTNIRYPAYERDSGIQGRVLVRFIVNKDGSVSDAVVKHSISPGLDTEALRVVNSLPKFKPGKQQGKPARVYFLLPVTFKLN